MSDQPKPPAFVDRLSELRAAATPGVWKVDDSEEGTGEFFADDGTGHGPLLMANDADIEITSLLVNHAEAILALVKAAETLAQGHQDCTPTSGCGVAALRPLLEALNRG